jgi:hypothetical protein
MFLNNLAISQSVQTRETVALVFTLLRQFLDDSNS